MTTSEKVRDLWNHLFQATEEELDALADEVAELEKQRVPDGWMPYWLVHKVTEDEVFVDPGGWWLEPAGDSDKSTRLGDFRLPFQEAIRLAEAAKGVTA